MKISTFYSYKGGTGRTLALANVASFAATAGKRVFVLDMDLEAPGATYKLLNPEQQKQNVNRGLVGYLLDSMTGRSLDLSRYVVQVDRLAGYVQGRKPRGALWLMPAGRVPDPQYFGDLKRLNLDARVDDGTATAMLQSLIRVVHERYQPDLLLIDSRTGITGTNTLVLAELADDVYAFVLDLPEQLEGTRSVLRSLAPLSAVGRPMLHAVMSRLPLDDQHIGSGWIRTEGDQVRERKMSAYLREPTHPERFTLGSVDIHQLHHNGGLIENEELLLTLLGRRGVAEEALAWDYARLARAVINDDGAMAEVAGRLLSADRSPDQAVAAVIFDDPELRSSTGINRMPPISEAPARNLPQRIDAQRIVAREDPAGLPQLAELLVEMANAQAAIGNQDASLEAAVEAVDIYGRLAGVVPGARSAYAHSLSMLAMRLEEAGRLFESIEATQQAVELLRGLPSSDKERDPALAMALLRLASLLDSHSDLALASVENAIRVFRRVVRRSRRHISQLRRALILKSNLLSARDQSREALQAAEESLLGAENHAPRVDEMPSLVEAMSTLALRLAEVGDRERAHQQFAAAVAAAEELSEPGGEGEALLAGTLHSQALFLAEWGDLQQAERASARSSRLFRRLASEIAEYRPQLAAALRTHGSVLLRRGRAKKAVAELSVSVAVSRELMRSDAQAQGQLAISLCDLAEAQVACGLYRDAAGNANEAVHLSRSLAENHEYDGRLADALATYSGALLAANHVDEAAAPAHESMKIFKRLSSTDERLRPKHAMALMTSAEIARRLGRQRDALHDASRAVQEFRSVSLQDRRFRLPLARALNLVSSCLATVNRLEDAMRPLDESISLLHQLAKEGWATSPEQADALLKQSVLSRQLGRTADSVELCRSSVAIYRRLAAGDAAYSVTLQRALRELAKGLDAVGDVVAGNEVREEAENITKPRVEDPPD